MVYEVPISIFNEFYPKSNWSEQKTKSSLGQSQDSLSAFCTAPTYGYDLLRRGTLRARVLECTDIAVVRVLWWYLKSNVVFYSGHLLEWEGGMGGIRYFTITQLSKSYHLFI